jgi:hydroxyacylglutathione hydrolase
MILQRMPIGVYAANCYLIACEETKEAIVVDPGGESEEIIKKSDELGVNIKYILLTHAHGDHIGGLKDLKKEIGCPVLIHKDDEDMLLDAQLNLSAHMSMDDVMIKPDRLLEDGDVINVGNLQAVIIHTPGHTQGGISIKVNNIILSGDTLFKGSIGRTDLYGGSFDDIIDSIKNKILVFPDEYEIYPGHGPSTTVGFEKRNNPFVNK